jgi:hypothetical protein
MSRFVENSTDFSAECLRHHGRCPVLRENFVFLVGASEREAIDRLQWKCGCVVIIPDASHEGRSLSYHTSCRRMSDVVEQIFRGRRQPAVRLPQRPSEMSLGELHRCCVTVAYDDCRARIDGFGLHAASQQ